MLEPMEDLPQPSPRQSGRLRWQWPRHALRRALRPGVLTALAASAILGQHGAAADGITLTQAACTGTAIAASIAADAIGEPVSGVVLESLEWVAESGNVAAHCLVGGRLQPVDTSDTAQPIRFGVALPDAWNGRSIQLGGGGMNGTVPRLTGSVGGFGGPAALTEGYVTYGSDSGHASDPIWALNDEAIRNLGYAQMKKTHDVAMVLVERAYGERPAYNYYVGGSQGGREGLTVAQRYPEDYDGVLSTVPVVGMSSLMLAPTLTRIQERALANHVPPSKGPAMLAEFMRQCDGLDGRIDGVINNYVDCRALFNVNDTRGSADPWARLRCPDDVDPDPEDSSVDACLTAGQIDTMNFVFSSYRSPIPLANGRETFGMWAPSSAVGGGGFGPAGGLFVAQRYRGQEGAPDDAPVFSALGSIGVNGFMMRDLDANPLDYDIERHGARRAQISPWLDSTDPDLSAFGDRGGRLIVIVGTDDTIAPSGEQLDYYQSMLDTMGRTAVDAFARLYVLPQTGHGLTGNSASIDGRGNGVQPAPIPSSVDRFGLLRDWVEHGRAPGLSEVVTGASGSRPMCSYPNYPHYIEGDPDAAQSYTCAAPAHARSGVALIPHPSWDAYMPEGIPAPESGTPVFELHIPLDLDEAVGTTPYGERRVAVGLAGSVDGAWLSGTVMEGALDFELTLSNGTLEIEQIFVLRADDGDYILVRGAGVGPDADDVRIVLDFEAPNAGDHARLNAGRYVARRELRPSDATLRLVVYDVSSVTVTQDNAIHIVRPNDVPAQPWNNRLRQPGEQPAEPLSRALVTLSPSQRVGDSKRGPRNIIPITGGEVSGRVSGRVLAGGADYQLLASPPTIDARYLWQTDDGEIIIIRNGGAFGALVPTFEARMNGPYAFLNEGRYLSSDPGMGQGGVQLTFYDSIDR